MPNPNVVVICSDPDVGKRQYNEIWRGLLLSLTAVKPNLHVLNIERDNALIPMLPASLDSTKKSVLLITGEHGDVETGIYNEVQIAYWEKWIQSQSHQAFDLIIIDFCDSAPLGEKLLPLLKPQGVIVSSIATAHGMLRDALIEVNFESMSRMLQAVKTNIENTMSLLGGSNLSFITKNNPSSSYSFFHSQSPSKQLIKQLIYDAKVPSSLDFLDNEHIQRGKVLQHLNEMEVKQLMDLSSYVDELSKTMSAEGSNNLKTALLILLLGIGLGLIYNLMNNSVSSNFNFNKM